MNGNDLNILNNWEIKMYMLYLCTYSKLIIIKYEIIIKLAFCSIVQL